MARLIGDSAYDAPPKPAPPLYPPNKAQAPADNTVFDRLFPQPAKAVGEKRRQIIKAARKSGAIPLKDLMELTGLSLSQLLDSLPVNTAADLRKQLVESGALEKNPNDVFEEFLGKIKGVAI